MGFLGNSDTNFKAPTSYYSSILSGNPASVAGALSPEISQLQSAYQQNKQQVDQFAPMGGGRASFMAQLPFQRASAVTNLISGARQDAAKGLTGIAGTQGALGSSLLGVGTQAAGAFGNQATTQNLADYLHSSATGSALSQMLINALKNNPTVGKVLSKIPGLGGGTSAPSGGGGGGGGSIYNPASDPFGGSGGAPTGNYDESGIPVGSNSPSTSSDVTGYYDPATGATFDSNGNPVSLNPYGSIYDNPWGGDPNPFNTGGDYGPPVGNFDESGIPVSSPYTGFDWGNPSDPTSPYYNPYEFYKG